MIGSNKARFQVDWRFWSRVTRCAVLTSLKTRLVEDSASPFELPATDRNHDIANW